MIFVLHLFEIFNFNKNIVMILSEEHHFENNQFIATPM